MRALSHHLRLGARPTALAVLLVLLVLLGAAPAYAAGPHVPLVMASIPVIGPIVSGVGGALGGIFSSITGAVFGAFTWTIGLATHFLLTTIAALVHMLIPQSWMHKGLQITQWIVAVPDYAGKITAPGGGHEYGFAGINAIRETFEWLGIAVAPLTLVYATSRAMIGEGDPVAVPVLRIVAVTIVIASYPYWWAQAAALTDQVTNMILSIPAVSRGLYRLMEYAVGGVALGGWQLIDLGLMGAIAIELLALIFLKVVTILLGALLYATGPLMIGLVPTRAGSTIARAWASAAVALLSLGIAWATLFAVGAALISDSGTAGPLIAGSSAMGTLVGGILLAVAGLASLWLCIKASREAAGLLRMQFSGMRILTHHHAGGAQPTSASTAQRTTGQSLREYRRRLAGAASAAGGELALGLAGAGPAGAGLLGAGRAVGQVGRRGLIGTAAAAAGRAGRHAAPPVAATFARSRAGAVAVNMARAGTASWQTRAAASPNSGRGAAGRSSGTGGARTANHRAGANGTAAGTVRGDRPNGGHRRAASSTTRPAHGSAPLRTAGSSPPAAAAGPSGSAATGPAGADGGRSAQPAAAPASTAGKPSRRSLIGRPTRPPRARKPDSQNGDGRKGGRK